MRGCSNILAVLAVLVLILACIGIASAVPAAKGIHDGDPGYSIAMRAASEDIILYVGGGGILVFGLLFVAWVFGRGARSEERHKEQMAMMQKQIDAQRYYATGQPPTNQAPPFNPAASNEEIKPISYYTTDRKG